MNSVVDILDEEVEPYLLRRNYTFAPRAANVDASTATSGWSPPPPTLIAESLLDQRRLFD